MLDEADACTSGLLIALQFVDQPHRADGKRYEK